jgi:hypothetical protein
MIGFQEMDVWAERGSMLKIRAIRVKCNSYPSSFGKRTVIYIVTGTKLDIKLAEIEGVNPTREPVLVNRQTGCTVVLCVCSTVL